MKRTLLALTCVFALASPLLFAQAVGGPEKGAPVPGDKGMTFMRVMERPEFFVLRDWAEPGAVRRMHNHPNTAWHVLTLVTGQLRLTIEGREPIDVRQGDVIDLPGAVMHTFTNTGTVTATIVEVFGRSPRPSPAVD